MIWARGHGSGFLSGSKSGRGCGCGSRFGSGLGLELGRSGSGSGSGLDRGFGLDLGAGVCPGCYLDFSLGFGLVRVVFAVQSVLMQTQTNSFKDMVETFLTSLRHGCLPVYVSNFEINHSLGLLRRLQGALNQ